MSLYSAYKKGNPYSNAHCSKVNRFEHVHVAYKLRTTHPLFIGTFLASGLLRMTEYNVMTHFLQVFVIGLEDCSECCFWQFRWMSALLFT